MPATPHLLSRLRFMFHPSPCHHGAPSGRVLSTSFFPAPAARDDSFRYHRCKLVSMSCLHRKGPAFGPQISLQEQSPPSLPLNRALSAGQDGFPASGHEGATVARPVLAVREEQSSRCGPQSGRLFSYSNAVECRGTEETCAHLWNPSEPAAGV